MVFGFALSTVFVWVGLTWICWVVFRSSLRIVDLDDRPRFTSLSYTWEQGASWNSSSHNVLKEVPIGGEGSDTGIESVLGIPDETKRKIICDGQIAEVQPNLYRCVLQLRQT
ncbi:hypothetical protein RRF57_000969 [Xylaria bambusicola]|uniref:Uncharacterized protein n=1 Tax=Xylaria bambusicola TaxID=326684 RepID=A0AAN7Z330_9PEZI